jgi:hypothetical protein
MDAATVQQPNNLEGPDLGSQFEDLLVTVWASEANWRFDDRLDLAARLQPGSRLRSERS